MRNPARARREFLPPWLKILTLAALLAGTGVAHWVTPTDDPQLHVLHVILRKLFFLPVVLGCIWYDVRGAWATALLATAIYLPHVGLQWQGQLTENANQVGEIVTIWMVAAVGGNQVRAERAALREAAETHRGAFLSLVAALDAREHETEVHSLRVAAYATRIGRELGMARDGLDRLEQAALLHDVGKIGVPDRILLSERALTEPEWETMKKHPGVGRRLLEPVPGLQDVAEVVYTHHERYDGLGYPRGLKRDAIPYAARVFAVADAFDAMTTPRPYRKEGMSCEAARGEIQREAGQAFDPKVVDAFLRVSCAEWEKIGRRAARRKTLSAISPEGTEQEGSGAI